MSGNTLRKNAEDSSVGSKPMTEKEKQVIQLFNKCFLCLSNNIINPIVIIILLCRAKIVKPLKIISAIVKHWCLFESPDS